MFLLRFQDGIDTMKMKQKQGIVTVHVKQKNYFLKVSVPSIAVHSQMLAVLI